MKIDCSKVPLKDKGCHMGIGAVIGAALPVVIPVGWVLVMALIIAFGKEIHDRNTTGFDVEDIIATLTGTITGICLYQIL